ncbi:FAD-binding oxidoreductase [soil metagenome]
MATANVVVIGGGVNGTSTAFHLAKMGMTDVALLERRQLAAGATGKSGALVRMHYTNPFESKLAYESLKIFSNWGEEVGGDCGFEAIGFVQIAPQGYEDALRKNVQDQQELGIDTRLVSKEELKELQPEMYVDDIGGAAYEASSGWADPNATTYAFAEAARKLGVRIETFCKATRIVTENDKVVAVETTNGRIETPAVVMATGAWSNPLLDLMGLDFGLSPRRVQLAIFHWPDGFQGPHAAVIDTVAHSWLRPDGTRSTLIGAEHSVEELEPEQFNETVSPEIIEHARATLSHRFPAFENATMRGGWSGMYTMSPDQRPIIDQIPSVGGLYCMLGDSGSSFKTGPAIGKCLAEWIIHGEPQTADLSPFNSTRFAEGKLWTDEKRYGDSVRTISR